MARGSNEAARGSRKRRRSSKSRQQKAKPDSLRAAIRQAAHDDVRAIEMPRGCWGLDGNGDAVFYAGGLAIADWDSRYYN